MNSQINKSDWFNKKKYPTNTIRSPCSNTIYSFRQRHQSLFSSKKKVQGRSERVRTCQRRLRSQCAAWESGRGMLQPLGYVNTHIVKIRARTRGYSPAQIYPYNTPLGLLLVTYKKQEIHFVSF